MLVASCAGQRVEAAQSFERTAPYNCPGCSQTVILKRGQIKVPHFAHKPPTQCDYAVGETLAHLAAKQWMVDGLRERGYSAELEVSLDYNRADILVAGQNQ